MLKLVMGKGDIVGIEFNFSPRDYQLTARYDINTAIRENEHPLLVMPTGTGKSKTSAMIISDQIKLGKTVFVICPQVEIFNQLLGDYAFMNPGYVNDEGLKGINRKLYVCMAISLSNILHMIPEKLHPQIIVTDECHHSKADTWESIYKHFFKANRIGLTATPCRTDGKPLGDLYTKIIEPITIKEALNRGYLSPPIVITPEYFLQDIPVTDDIDEKKQAEILGEPQIIGNVLDTYERVLNGLPTLFACCGYKQANDTMMAFRQAGWVAEHIHGNLSSYDRKSLLKRTADGEINALFTVGVGIEGLDVSGLHALAYLRRTVSTTIYVQFNGRPMRLGKNKKNCFIIDFVGNCVIHGMPDRVRKWDLEKGDITDELEDQTAFQKCPDCGTFNHIDNTECHFCGCDLSDEAKKEGTCRRCKNWKKGECIHQDSMFKPCPIWLLFPGCPSFQKRGRSLPAVIDGELVAIDSEMNRYELKKRTEKTKEEIKNRIEQEEKKKMECEEVTAFEKRKIISKGLFADEVRRSLFADAIGGM